MSQPRLFPTKLRSALAVLLSSALSLSPLAVHAAPNRTSAGLQREAERLYEAGKYREAAETLKKATAKDNDPTLLFNIARAYEQAAELPDALDYYKQYLEVGDDETLVRRSQLAVDRIGALLVKQTEGELERKRLSEEAARAQAEAETASQERNRAEQAELEARTRRESSAKTGSFVAGGLGVAALGTGVAFGLLALSAKNDFAQAPTIDEKRTLEDTVKSRALIADIGFGLGIAAAVTAFLLYPKADAPPSFDDDQPQARLLIGPGAAGVEVKF